MSVFGKAIWGITWRTALFCLPVALVIGWMNHNDRWDANEALNSANNYVEGDAGLIVVGLAQPERFEEEFFINFLEKVFTEAIPWPINALAGADGGVVLMDPARPFAPKRFEPTQLQDLYGKAVDVDGTPWIERYRRGELRWEKPSATVPHDTGMFLYPGRKQGIRTPAAKTAAKARYLYYQRLPNGYLPHFGQTVGMSEGAIRIAQARYPIKKAAFASAFDPKQKADAVRSVLDSGIKTLVLASAQPIQSDFEELNGSFASVYKTVKTWEAEHPGKSIKIVVAPSLAMERPYEQLWLDHFASTVPPATKPSDSAMGIITLHGLPPALAFTDSWKRRSDKVVARLKPQMEAILKAKGYGRYSVAAGAEGFSDKLEDPDNLLVSAAELFTQARAAKRTIAVAIPIEFLAENTDTLFAHSALMFDGLPGYSLYQGPPAGTDWSDPFKREFVANGTRIIYAGSPGGAQQGRASEALALAIGRVFPEKSASAQR